MIRPTLLAASLAAGLVLLAGCGAGGGSTSGTAPTTGTGQARTGGQRPPGVSGLIAARSGTTLQVQGTSEQTAVTWTAKTTFTQTKAATAATLRSGLCVSVRTADAGASAGTSPATTVAASSVTLSPEVDGGCTGGLGGGLGGTRPSGAPSGAPPGGAPSGAPSGAAGGFGGRGTDGAVTSVDGATFVVAAREPGGTATTDVTVTTSSATTWSEVAKTSAKAATVGRCAFAGGTTDGTGALTATTIRLSAPGADGTCGFGGRGSGQGRQGQAATPNG